MFSRRNNDELISAYIDGRLDERTRQALEARIDTDAALRQRVDATRVLVRTARGLPALSVPRNFILPAGAAPARQPTRTPAGARLWWRFGSALAAVVFVAAVAISTLGGLPVAQPMMSAAPQSAPATAAQAAPGAVAPTAAPAATAAPAVRQGAADQSSQLPQATAAPETPQAKMQAALVATPTAESTISAAAALAPQAAETPTAAAESAATVVPGAGGETPAPKAFALRAAPESSPTPIVESAPPPVVVQAEPSTQTSLWRIVAALALLTAIGTAIMGWLRR